MMSITRSTPQALVELLAKTSGSREETWEGRNILLINQEWGSLIVSLHGAQVLHFAPKGQPGWIWTTSTPKTAPEAIRGGIPLCWPWFGDKEDGTGPAHGYARISQWRLDAQEDEYGGENIEGVELHLSPVEKLDEQLSPRVLVQANKTRLRIELITEHVGETPVRFTQALHSYFSVGNSHSCKVNGLAGTTYIDKLNEGRTFDQMGELAIRDALDRIYHSSRPLELVDPRSDETRHLRIAKEGSDSSVVWHPGNHPPSDIPEDELFHFLCVEAACTQLDPIWLAPGSQHVLVQHITLEHE